METCELQKRNGHRAARSVPVAGKPAGLSAGILALLAVCWFLAVSFTAQAAGGLEMSTSYPGQTVKPGDELTSSAPTDWTVEFSESSISVLEAGTTYEVTAYVTPAEDALSGDYTFTLSASNSEVSSDAEFRVSVKTETVWGIVAVVLIAAAAGGLYLVFRKYGRQ